MGGHQDCRRGTVGRGAGAQGPGRDMATRGRSFHSSGRHRNIPGQAGPYEAQKEEHMRRTKEACVSKDGIKSWFLSFLSPCLRCTLAFLCLNHRSFDCVAIRPGDQFPNFGFVRANLISVLLQAFSNACVSGDLSYGRWLVACIRHALHYVLTYLDF